MMVEICAISTDGIHCQKPIGTNGAYFEFILTWDIVDEIADISKGLTDHVVVNTKPYERKVKVACMWCKEVVERCSDRTIPAHDADDLGRYAGYQICPGSYQEVLTDKEERNKRKSDKYGKQQSW